MRAKKYLCASVLICVYLCQKCSLFAAGRALSQPVLLPSCRQVDPCRKCAAPIMRRAPLPLLAKRSNVVTVTMNSGIASIALRPVAERATPGRGWLLTLRARQLHAVPR